MKPPKSREFWMLCAVAGLSIATAYCVATKDAFAAAVFAMALGADLAMLAMAMEKRTPSEASA